MGYRARRSFDKFDKFDRFGGSRNSFMQEPTGMLPGDDVGNRKVHKPLINPPDDIGNRRQMERLEKMPPDDIGNHIERAPTHELSMSLFDNHGKLRRPPKAAERIGRYIVGGVNPLVSGAAARYSPPPSAPVAPVHMTHTGPTPPSPHMPMPMMPMDVAMMPPDAMDALDGMEENTIFIPPTGLPMDAMPSMPMMAPNPMPIPTPPAPVRSRFDRNRNKQDPRGDVRSDPRFDSRLDARLDARPDLRPDVRLDARVDMHVDNDSVMNQGAPIAPSTFAPSRAERAERVERAEEAPKEYREQKFAKKHEKQQNQQQNQQAEKSLDRQGDKYQDRHQDKHQQTPAASSNVASSAASTAPAGKLVEIESPEKKLQRFIDLDDDDRFDYVLKSEPAQKAQKAQEVAADIVRLCGRKATVTSQIIDDDGKSRVLIVLDEHGAADEIPAERRHETIDEPLFSLDSFPALLTLNYFVNKSVNRYPDDRIRLAVLPAKNIDLYLKLLEKHRAERIQKSVMVALSVGEGHVSSVAAEITAVSIPTTTIQPMDTQETTVAEPVVVVPQEVLQEPAVILAPTAPEAIVVAPTAAAETPSAATEMPVVAETAVVSVEGTPAPRRRGRPPKAKPVVEDTQIALPAIPAISVQTESVVENNAIDESKPVLSEISTTVISAIPTSAEAVSMDNLTPVVGTVVETVVEIAPAPRRRGRPPKAKPVVETVAETAAEAIVEATSVPAAAVEVPTSAPVVEAAPVAEVAQGADVVVPAVPTAPAVPPPTAPSEFAPVIAFVEIETAAPRPRRRRKTEE